MPEPTAQAVVDAWASMTDAQHGEHCWQWHPRCAIGILGGRIAALEEQLRDLAVETDRLRGAR